MLLNFTEQLSLNAQSTTEVSALITTECYQKEKPQWQLCPPKSSPTSCSQIQLKKPPNLVLFIWALSSLLSPLRPQGPAPGAHDRFGEQLVPLSLLSATGLQHKNKL